MVAVTFAFSGCLGSSISVASKLRNCEVKCEKPRWFTRKIRLACEGSSLYSPAGKSVVTGLMASGTAETVGCTSAAATSIPIAKSRYMTRPSHCRWRPCRNMHGRQIVRSHRLFADHHPVRAEAIGDHAEASGEKGFGQRHIGRDAFRQCGEDTLRLFRRLHANIYRVALRLVVAASRRIRAHDGVAADGEARVH